MSDKPEGGTPGIMRALLGLFELRLPRWVGRIEDALLVGLLLALVVLGLVQIGLRNFGGIPVPWADGAMRAGVLWITMLASAVAARELRHIRIDVLERFLAARAVGLVQGLMLLGTSAVCAAMVWYSGRMIQLERAFESNAFLNVPSWMVMMIIPVGFTLMGWRFLRHALGVGSSPRFTESEPDT